MLQILVRRLHYTVSQRREGEGRENRLFAKNNIDSLSDACMRGHLDIITFLLEHGADANAINR
jgi:ankyrin repeat protein